MNVSDNPQVLQRLQKVYKTFQISQLLIFTKIILVKKQQMTLQLFFLITLDYRNYI